MGCVCIGPVPHRKRWPVLGVAAEVNVVEGASVNIPIRMVLPTLPRPDVDSHQPVKSIVDLRHDGTGAVVPSLPEKAKIRWLAPELSIMHGIGDAEGPAARGAVRLLCRCVRADWWWCSHRRRSSPDRRTEWAGSAGIDGPQLSKLIAHEKAPALGSRKRDHWVSPPHRQCRRRAE